MGTAREVGAGGLENCDQADRAEQGKGLLYGILVLRRVLDAEGQGTSHVHGRGEGKALLLLNERIGARLRRFDDGGGPALFAGLGFRRIYLPDDARGVLPGNVRRQAGRKLRQGKRETVLFRLSLCRGLHQRDAVGFGLFHPAGFFALPLVCGDDPFDILVDLGLPRGFVQP